MQTKASTTIEHDNAGIEHELLEAQLPCLLASLAYLTGDLTLLRDDLKADPLLANEEQGGLTAEQQADIRSLALDSLVKFRDGGNVQAPTPAPDVIHRIMEHAVGQPVALEYLGLMKEELSVTGLDLRAPTWTKDELAPQRDFTVAIIGAGMSGLVAAHRLHQAGVPFVILEKNHDVGGTWLENTYPGCRVDVPNHVYSYSFAQRADWPLHFSTQDVLLDYFQRCATEFGLRDYIRFNTSVVNATWEESTATWAIDIEDHNGPAKLTAHALVSAVGQLNRPNIPAISGQERFSGPSFHSARWRHDVDLTGKRVAVIGTGASALQFVPVIAADVAHLDLFQRTPNWMFPVPHYHEQVPAGLQWLFGHVPSYAQWYRFWLFWRGAEGILPACAVDPEWPNLSQSVSQLNKDLRDLLATYLEVMYGDRPDLIEKCVPQYPPASKRIVLDNGSWPLTLMRDNVDVIVEGISHITETAVVTSNGVEHPVDVIIYATGFTPSKFLTPMTMTGRNGIDLHQQWDGDARAYLGMTFPNFPNFFCLYGPNTNIVVNGSIVYFSECEVHYVVDAIKTLLTTNSGSLEVLSDVHDEFNVIVDAANQRMAWGVATVNTWYQNEHGRVAQNWPFSLLEFWQRTRAVNVDDYYFEPLGTTV